MARFASRTGARSAFSSSVGHLFRTLLVIGLALLVAAGLFAQVVAAAVPAPDTSSSQILVKFKGSATAVDVQAALRANGGSVTRDLSQIGTKVISVPTAARDRILAAYQQSASVERASAAIQLHKSDLGVNDPSSADQWALTKINWAPAYSGIPIAGSATIAILDTGIDATHPDLAGRVSAGQSFVGGEPNSDANGHGTALAGIAAANVNNGIGIAGVAYAGVNVASVQVLGADGVGTDGDVVAGLLWAADNGASVVLMAFSSADYSQALADAVNYAWSHGVVLIAATGNNGSSAYTYPAGMANVVGVTATDESDNVASASNTGSASVAAPGVGIVTAAAGGAYTTISGTSASAAEAAGLAALLRANGASNAATSSQLRAGSDALVGQSFGRINVAAAFTADATLPSTVGTGIPSPTDPTYTVSGDNTSTVVSCTPTTLAVLGTSTCTATVTNTKNGATATPAGSVVFTNNGSASNSANSSDGDNGTWSPDESTDPNARGQCTLTPISGSSPPAARCSSVYTALKATKPNNPNKVVHDIRAKYDPSVGDFNSSNSAANSMILTVNANAAAATTTTVSNATATYGGNASVSATLTSGGSPVSSKTISFVITADSKTTATVTGTTNGSGVATATISLCPAAGCISASASAYVGAIGASFAGDTALTASSGTGDLTVNKATSTTTVTVTDTAPITFDGNPHGATAQVTGAGGLSQSLTVSYVGRAGTTYPSSTTAPSNAGDYTASASFTGDANHFGSNDSKDYTINRAPTTISWSVPASVPEGTTFASVQTALGSVPGSFVYTATGGPISAGAFADNATYTLTAAFTPTDIGNYLPSTKDLSLVVTNVAPTVTIVSPALGSVYSVGTAVTFTGSFTDPGSADTHPTADWLFDSTTVPGVVNEAARSVTLTRTFTSAGVYMITLRVTDDDGGVGTTTRVGTDTLDDFIVIYDPNAGFATGGGWIMSPGGALVANPTATGRASFGFVSKYTNGAKPPTGETEFNFQSGNFNFHSTSYEWLVVSGARAQYKGSGTINGSGDFGFMLTAIDGQVNGGGGADKFRLKVWNKTTLAIIYDNQVGTGVDTTDSATPITGLGGGSIVIHAK
jgi:subtilisin family serine protease